MLEEKPHFLPVPPILVDFFLQWQTNGFIPGMFTFCLTMLNGNLISFCCFQPKTDCIPHSLSLRANMRGKQGFLRVQMGGWCLPSVPMCSAESDGDENKSWEWMGHRTCSSSGIKTVWGAVGACSGLLEHRLWVFMCGGMTCTMQARLVWARVKCEKVRRCDKQGRWKAGKWYVISIQLCRGREESVQQCVRVDPSLTELNSVCAVRALGRVVQTSHVRTMQRCHTLRLRGGSSCRGVKFRVVCVWVPPRTCVISRRRGGWLAELSLMRLDWWLKII